MDDTGPLKPWKGYGGVGGIHIGSLLVVIWFDKGMQWLYNSLKLTPALMFIPVGGLMEWLK